MTVEFFIQSEPQHAHETGAILALAQAMRRAFAASDRFYLLAANVRFWRAQADVLALTEHAIVLIELKSCDDPIFGRAQGAWRMLSSTAAPRDCVRGGSYENPCQQVVATREILIKYLDRNRSRFLSNDRAQEMKGQWGHVSAAIVFSPGLHPDSDIVMPPQSRAWLGVIGLNEVAEFLFSRFSPCLDLRPQELRRLASEALGCRPWAEIETLLPPTANYGHLWLMDETGHWAYAFPILDGATIGRSRDNTLVVPRHCGRVSRHHAHLGLVGDAVWLYDHKSTYGTFVNHKPLPPEGQPLHDGDTIHLGGVDHPEACQLRFERQARLDVLTESTGGNR